MKRRPPPRLMIIAITKSFFCLGVSSLKNFFMDPIRKSSLPQTRGLVDHEKTVFKVTFHDGRIQGDGSRSLGQKHEIDLADLDIIARNHPVFLQNKPFGPYNPPQTQFHRREPYFRDGSIALHLLNGKGIRRKLVHIGHLEELQYLFLVNKPLEHGGVPLDPGVLPVGQPDRNGRRFHRSRYKAVDRFLAAYIHLRRRFVIDQLVFLLEHLELDIDVASGGLHDKPLLLRIDDILYLPSFANDPVDIGRAKLDADQRIRRYRQRPVSDRREEWQQGRKQVKKTLFQSQSLPIFRHPLPPLCKTCRSRK